MFCPPVGKPIAEGEVHVPCVTVFKDDFVSLETFSLIWFEFYCKRDFFVTEGDADGDKICRTSCSCDAINYSGFTFPLLSLDSWTVWEQREWGPTIINLFFCRMFMTSRHRLVTQLYHVRDAAILVKWWVENELERTVLNLQLKKRAILG